MPKMRFNLTGKKKKRGLPMEEIANMVKFMDENELSEISIEDRGRLLTIKKNGHGSYMAGEHHQGLHAGMPKAADIEESFSAITAPTVGIFHLGSSSNNTPFVSEGDIVGEGQVVGLIETLKVMSEVKAEKQGKIISIEARDGEMVEFGETLMLLEEV